MKTVPFEYEHKRYLFESDVPTQWYEVTEKEFTEATQEINYNYGWYSGLCIYRGYGDGIRNKTLGVYDEKMHKWFLNPDYFSKNLDPSTHLVCGD